MHNLGYAEFGMNDKLQYNQYLTSLEYLVKFSFNLTNITFYWDEDDSDRA